MTFTSQIVNKFNKDFPCLINADYFLALTEDSFLSAQNKKKLHLYSLEETSNKLSIDSYQMFSFDTKKEFNIWFNKEFTLKNVILKFAYGNHMPLHEFHRGIVRTPCSCQVLCCGVYLGSIYFRNGVSTLTISNVKNPLLREVGVVLQSY